MKEFFDPIVAHSTEVFIGLGVLLLLIGGIYLFTRKKSAQNGETGGEDEPVRGVASGMPWLVFFQCALLVSGTTSYGLFNQLLQLGIGVSLLCGTLMVGTGVHFAIERNRRGFDWSDMRKFYFYLISSLASALTFFLFYFESEQKAMKKAYPEGSAEFLFWDRLRLQDYVWDQVILGKALVLAVIIVLLGLSIDVIGVTLGRRVKEKYPDTWAYYCKTWKFFYDLPKIVLRWSIKIFLWVAMSVGIAASFVLYAVVALIMMVVGIFARVVYFIFHHQKAPGKEKHKDAHGNTTIVNKADRQVVQDNNRQAWANLRQQIGIDAVMGLGAKVIPFWTQVLDLLDDDKGDDDMLESEPALGSQELLGSGATNDLNSLGGGLSGDSPAFENPGGGADDFTDLTGNRSGGSEFGDLPGVGSAGPNGLGDEGLGQLGPTNLGDLESPQTPQSGTKNPFGNSGGEAGTVEFPNAGGDDDDGIPGLEGLGASGRDSDFPGSDFDFQEQFGNGTTGSDNDVPKAQPDPFADIADEDGGEIPLPGEAHTINGVPQVTTEPVDSTLVPGPSEKAINYV